MKTILIAIAIICSLQVNAQKATLITKTITVNGNCGMCKTTIEKAAKKAGAQQATWIDSTLQLTVQYYYNKTSISKIKEKIASVGYDTEGVSATDAAYNNLHGCCKYQRKPIELPKTNNK
jgi:periplasmic mercuric ion binding protein